MQTTKPKDAEDIGRLVNLAWAYEIRGVEPPHVRHFHNGTRLYFSPEQIALINHYGYFDLPPEPTNMLIHALRKRGN